MEFKRKLQKRENITVKEFFAQENVPTELKRRVHPVKDYLIAIYKQLEKDVCGDSADIEKYATGSYSYIGWKIRGAVNNSRGTMFAEIHFKSDCIDIHTLNAENGIKIASPQTNRWRLSKHVIITSKEGKEYDEAVRKLRALI